MEIDLLYGWAVLERRPNHVNKRVVADIWLLTVSWTLTWEVIRKRNLYCFMYRQHIWLRKWEVIVGGHDWSCWDLWIWGGRGFVGVQRRSCWLCSHHRIIMKFSGVITNDQSKVHAKGQGQKSKVKVPEVTTQLNHFRTVTPVWIHIWWWNDAYSLMLLRRGALLFFKVILQISRSHGSKNRRIWPRLGVSGL